VVPLQGAGERSLRSGGLRCAPTTGYYLTALQAEEAPHSILTMYGTALILTDPLLVKRVV
jgi:hypothetical protein